MRKFALAAAAIAALAFSAPAFTTPALAQGVTVKIGSGDRGHRDGWRHRDSRKVVIHRDRGRHEGWRHRSGRHDGWRHRDVGMKKKVIIRHGAGGTTRTVIKKYDR
jgi:hypothetical protein